MGCCGSSNTKISTNKESIHDEVVVQNNNKPSRLIGKSLMMLLHLTFLVIIIFEDKIPGITENMSIIIISYVAIFVVLILVKSQRKDG
ncbi:MAG: hypothetical protein QM489_02340 [Candidatus Izemoplasma sp.]